jgi:outer membrane protein
MKKIIAILWLPKLLAVTLLFIACGNSDTGQDKPVDTTPTEEKQAVETKIADIAYIRLDSIIQKYDYYHDLKREFDQKVKKKSGEFESKVNALRTDVKALQEKYEKVLITRSEVEEQSQHLQQREYVLQNEDYPKMMQELGEEENVMNRKVMNEIQVYVEKYNEEKKYSLILNANMSVIVGAPSMDITAEIIKGLNQEYIANRAKK